MPPSASTTLGKFPLPVEVVRFGLTATRNMIEALAADAGCEGEIKLRLAQGRQAVRHRQRQLILDCAFGRIDEPEELDEALKLVPGVVENGLFLGIADVAIIAGPDGVVVIERDAAAKSAEAPARGAPAERIEPCPIARLPSRRPCLRARRAAGISARAGARRRAAWPPPRS